MNYKELHDILQLQVNTKEISVTEASLVDNIAFIGTGESEVTPFTESDKSNIDDTKQIRKIISITKKDIKISQKSINQAIKKKEYKKALLEIRHCKGLVQDLKTQIEKLPDLSVGRISGIVIGTLLATAASISIGMMRNHRFLKGSTSKHQSESNSTNSKTKTSGKGIEHSTVSLTFPSEDSTTTGNGVGHSSYKIRSSREKIKEYEDAIKSCKDNIKMLEDEKERLAKDIREKYKGDESSFQVVFKGAAEQLDSGINEIKTHLQWFEKQLKIEKENAKNSSINESTIMMYSDDYFKEGLELKGTKIARDGSIASIGVGAVLLKRAKDEKKRMIKSANKLLVELTKMEQKIRSKAMS